MSREGRSVVITAGICVALAVSAAAWGRPELVQSWVGENGKEWLRLAGIPLWLLIAPCMALGLLQYLVSTPKAIRRAMGWRGWFS